MDRKHKYRRLHEYNHEGSDSVKKIEAGKTFHVVEGRNAWHSTWVVQYQKNSFYTSLPSAKEYAENIRKSGSVFTIVERPCLVIRSHKKTTIVTELNHSSPLAGHILGGEGGNIPETIAEDYRTRSHFLPDFIKGFMHSSFGWIRDIPVKGLLILQHENPEIKIKGVSHPLKARTSKSHGGEYLLSWHESNTTTSASSVLKLCDTLSHIIKSDCNPKHNIKNLDVSNENRLRILKAKITDFLGKQTNLTEEFRNGFAEQFIDEIKEAYTEKSILSAKEDDIFLMVLDWIRNLGKYAPEDRKYILVSGAIKHNNMPFTRHG